MKFLTFFLIAMTAYAQSPRDHRSEQVSIRSKIESCAKDPSCRLTKEEQEALNRGIGSPYDHSCPDCGKGWTKEQVEEAGKKRMVREKKLFDEKRKKLNEFVSSDQYKNFQKKVGSIGISKVGEA